MKDKMPGHRNPPLPPKKAQHFGQKAIRAYSPEQMQAFVLTISDAEVMEMICQDLVNDDYFEHFEIASKRWRELKKRKE